MKTLTIRIAQKPNAQLDMTVTTPDGATLDFADVRLTFESLRGDATLAIHFMDAKAQPDAAHRALVDAVMGVSMKEEVPA